MLYTTKKFHKTDMVRYSSPLNQLLLRNKKNPIPHQLCRTFMSYVVTHSINSHHPQLHNQLNGNYVIYTYHPQLHNQLNGIYVILWADTHLQFISTLNTLDSSNNANKYAKYNLLLFMDWDIFKFINFSHSSHLSV